LPGEKGAEHARRIVDGKRNFRDSMSVSSGGSKVRETRA